MGSAMRYQPQGRIRLNRNNPLVRGLVAAYVPRSGLRDATGTLATISDVTPVVSPLGYMTPPLNSGPCPVVGTFPFVRTDPISAFVLGRFAVSNDANTAPIISVGQFGGANGWKFGPLGTGGNLDLTFSSIADYPTTVPFPAIGSIAFSATPGANARIFTNGGFRQQISVGTPNGTLATARMAIGQRGDAAGDSTSASQVALALYWNRALSDAEQASLAANPWQLFEAGSSSSAYQSSIVSSSAGGGSTPTTISASTATSTINGGAAQVALPSTVAANQASESTAGLAAGITLPTTISASTATVADTGLAASISLPTSISASAATATDSGLTASVSTGSSISASQASETASGLAAGVVLPTVVSASQATASNSGLTASITTGAGIQASTATETETGLSASVSLPTVIGAAKATGTDAGLAATVTSGAGIQASTASEASAGQQAQITLPTVVAATEGSVTINCQPATVSIGESIKGSTGTGSDIGYPAQVSSTTGISASVATETSAVLAADINTYVPPLPINPLRLYVGEARARKLYGGKDDVQNLTEMIVGDVETFSYSFKRTLPSGATITGAVPHIVVHAGIDPNPQAMVIGQPTINGAIVSIELKALVPGVSYWPRMTATYSDRQQVTLPDPGKGSLSVVA